MCFFFAVAFASRVWFRAQIAVVVERVATRNVAVQMQDVATLHVANEKYVFIFYTLAATDVD